ncbi:MAG: helix-turn-helix transcriptional regulator [Myxococcales bacterium]|nr:helix-turn-helix transcriptional regulator [Myxococcales bacterium]
MEWLEGLEVGVGVGDLRGVIVRANRFLAALTGHLPAELVGRSVHELVPATAWPIIEEHRALRRAGQASSFRIDLTAKAGSARPVLVQGAPWLDSAGQVVGSVVLVTPVREIRAGFARIPAGRVAGCPLTPREREVATAIRGVESTRALAAAMGVSTHTVHAHLQSAFRKLGVSSRVGLVGAFDCGACAEGRFVCPKRRGPGAR